MPDDAPAIQKHFAQWEIIRHLSTLVPWPYPEDGAISFLRQNLLPRVESGDAYAWAITLKDGNDEAIGLIDFRLGTPLKGNRGFWIAREYQGRGLMTEALHVVHDFIFNVLKVESFVVCNAAANLASRRVKEKTGAVFIGHVDIPHHTGGSFSEKWLVTKESWLKTLGV